MVIMMTIARENDVCLCMGAVHMIFSTRYKNNVKRFQLNEEVYHEVFFNVTLDETFFLEQLVHTSMNIS